MNPRALVIAWILCLLVLASSACNQSPTAGTSAKESAKKQSADQGQAVSNDTILPPEEWAKKPPADWPQIVLTNEAEFKDHSGLHGASAFLIEAPGGKVLIATARHLIGEAGGVESPIPLKDLDSVLVSWKVYPRTKPEKAIAAGKLALIHPGKEYNDWLALSLADARNQLPALPLKIRTKPVQVGEPIFLVGCPYAEPDCVQNVYTGKVTRRLDDLFQYTLQPPVDLRGFSGAPIMDAHGLLVGVMALSFDRELDSGKDTLGGGEDAASLAELLANG